MNRPKRPTRPFQPPARRRPSGPPSSGGGTPPPRRRSPLDALPPGIEPPFKVLGTQVDRQALLSSAEPLELVVVQGFTREIEQAAQPFKNRPPEEFWKQNPGMIEQARKLDDILAKIQERKASA